ncbi:MAG: hypothetical protein ABTD50_23285 [Polyangiaceae bacterium]|jgi:hypothetical protein
MGTASDDALPELIAERRAMRAELDVLRRKEAPELIDFASEKERRGR